MPAIQPSPDPPADRAVPFLKWAGGKTQLLEQFAPLFPAESPIRYFEPFVGSGAVFFHLRHAWSAQDSTTYQLSDVNAELINVFVVVRDQLDALIALLCAHRDAHATDARQHYYQTRDLDRDPDWHRTVTPVERAARMIYLNRTCFNGLWRVNQKGYFNVPIGRYKNPSILNEPKLRTASAALAGTALTTRPFNAVQNLAGAGDFVYFDPPYVPLSSTSNFTSYAKDDFGEADQRALAQLVRILDHKGARVMLSNADAPLVHELYAGFRIERVSARRAINSRPGKRGPISEVVVLNY